ncbi:uroporphyrinogen-III C-methyltransferase [Vibrio sp. WXL210]|uniref:uroporphyrinogen-III C-methyltransferase n=1 Tax=Vibrio sp. WXL210 TaxID=3450709 RepID=UPI003EC524A3
MTKKNNEPSEAGKKSSSLDSASTDSPRDTETTQDSVAQSSDSSSKATPQPEPEASAEQAQPSTPPSDKPKKSGNTLAVLAIIIALGVGAAGFYKLQQQGENYQAEIAALRAQLDAKQGELSRTLEATKASTLEQAAELSNRADVAIEQQQNSIESLQVALADVKGRRPNDWLLAEADHLVKLAGRKLFLEKDVNTATRLMETADQRIAALNDPSLVPLRQQLATDITELKGIPLIDRDGLVLRLTALQQQVDGLPLANAILPEEPVEEPLTVSTDINDWQENLKNSLKSFSENFITFRSRDGSVIPLLSPQQHFYLSENIKGKLETAIRAVYLEQGEVYQISLENAREWSATFFDQENHQVKQFRQSLAELAEQEVSVDYPSKLASQQPLEDIIRDRLRREVSGIAEEEK